MPTRIFMRARSMVVLLVCLGAVGIAWASGSFEGQVLDRSGKAVGDEEAVVVSLVPTVDQSLRSYSAKVKKARFFFGSVDPGEYRIELKADRVGLDSMTVVTQDAKRKEVGRLERKILTGMDPVKIGVRRGEMSYFQLVLVVASLEEVRRAYAQIQLARVAKALQAGDIAETEKTVADLLKENPGDPMGLTLRAYVHGQLGRPAEAEADLLQALKGKPDLGDALYQLGDLYAGTDRGDQALEALGKVDASDADGFRKAQAAILVAQIYHSRGKLAEEAASLEKARAGSDEFAKDLVPQLIGLYLDLGRTAEAEALTHQATAKGSIDPSLLYNLAVSLFNRAQYDQAAKYFESAYEADSKLTDALKNLGICSMKQGDNRKAVDRLKKYLAESPKTKDADEIRSLIEALEGAGKGVEKAGGGKGAR